MSEKSSNRRSAPAEANVGPFMGPTAGFELWSQALAGVAKWNANMFEGLALLGSEWLDFVNRRLKADLSLPQRFCACRSPEEMREVHLTFWRQAVDDYQKEFTVMAKLGSGFVGSSVTAAQTRIKEAAREIQRPLSEAA